MRQNGFTLAEILVALLILAVIAAFTIPKILSASADSKFNSIAKEAAGMVSSTFQMQKLAGKVSSSTQFQDLLPYMNYAAVDTTSVIDQFNGSGSYDCASLPCIKLHNGAVIYYTLAPFAGTSNLHSIYFYIDPDGQYSGSTSGYGKSAVLWLYFNGRLTQFGNITPGTIAAGGTFNPCPSCDPVWLSW